MEEYSLRDSVESFETPHGAIVGPPTSGQRRVGPLPDSIARIMASLASLRFWAGASKSASVDFCVDEMHPAAPHREGAGRREINTAELLD